MRREVNKHMIMKKKRSTGNVSSPHNVTLRQPDLGCHASWGSYGVSTPCCHTCSLRWVGEEYAGTCFLLVYTHIHYSLSTHGHVTGKPQSFNVGVSVSRTCSLTLPFRPPLTCWQSHQLCPKSSEAGVLLFFLNSSLTDLDAEEQQKQNTLLLLDGFEREPQTSLWRDSVEKIPDIFSQLCGDLISPPGLWTPYPRFFWLSLDTFTY